MQKKQLHLNLNAAHRAFHYHIHPALNDIAAVRTVYRSQVYGAVNIDITADDFIAILLVKSAVYQNIFLH